MIDEFFYDYFYPYKLVVVLYFLFMAAFLRLCLFLAGVRVSVAQYA